MRTVADNHAANFQRPDVAAPSISETLLLAKIGADLRDLYRDVTASEPPPDLVGLARTIDAKRADDRSDT